MIASLKFAFFAAAAFAFFIAGASMAARIAAFYPQVGAPLFVALVALLILALADEWLKLFRPGGRRPGAPA